MLVFWVIAFPLLLLVIFGLIPSFKQTQPGYQGLTVLETYVPIIILTMLALLSFFSLPVTLATYREQRILRRLQTTPAGAWRVLAAQLAVTVGAGGRHGRRDPRARQAGVRRPVPAGARHLGGRRAAHRGLHAIPRPVHRRGRGEPPGRPLPSGTSCSSR